VLVHAGAEEAIFTFMNVTVQSGDHVVVHAPYYQSLGEVARSVGAEVSAWRGNPERAWELDMGDLKALLRPDTKVVVVNFPHNPTGFLPSASFVQELADLSERHGFVILSDEVYRGLELEVTDRLPSLADLNDRAAAIGVMSKTYGLAGLRIGWIATRNRTLLADLAAFKDYTTICSSAPSEFLATLALRNAQSIVGRNLDIIRRNLDLLDAFFAQHEDLFSWYRPKAGSVAFPALRRGSVAGFCSDLVEKVGILLLPGTLFENGSNAFRLGFGRANLPEVLDAFDNYLGKRGEWLRNEGGST
ncbi:MAG: aminotransferase class I/II-fold pyridoxal phosphate-dependent enzyme, partial [Deltaproteobacteria bacterium]|nr:aminotransferase class I/II-fold pyridoxal phosphate-dependent enzyme [Deltaproteobacteria bacterium]